MFQDKDDVPQRVYTEMVAARHSLVKLMATHLSSPQITPVFSIHPLVRKLDMIVIRRGLTRVYRVGMGGYV